MNSSELTYASAFTYCPRAQSERARVAKDLVRAMKNNSYDPKLKLTTAEALARAHCEKVPGTVLESYFHRATVIVPVPGSSPSNSNAFWVADALAKALKGEGLAQRSVALLRRATAVPRSSRSKAEARPSAEKHFASFEISDHFMENETFILVDDVVTRGATLLGAAARLREAFPANSIEAFAMVRTISDPDEFPSEGRLFQPCVGRIDLMSWGCRRRP
jgi:predicted amidophosphoribosyltransferase